MSVSDLFKPLTLLHGPAMRNRFMLAPLTSQQSDHDGTASKYDQLWMEQLSKGGYGLIQTSAATVEAGAIAFERQLGIHSDKHLPGLIQMATAIREGGTLSAVQSSEFKILETEIIPKWGKKPTIESGILQHECELLNQQFTDYLSNQ